VAGKAGAAPAPGKNILRKSNAGQKIPSQMKRNATPRSLNRGHAFVAGAVAAAFLWALALSASPQLHNRAHPDSNRTEHSCAVTLITSGSYSHSAPVGFISLPAPGVQFSTIPALTPQWVESLFIGACVFEHAPPARA
jgi:hypothetical protein